MVEAKSKKKSLKGAAKTAKMRKVVKAAKKYTY